MHQLVMQYADSVSEPVLVACITTILCFCLWVAGIFANCDVSENDRDLTVSEFIRQIRILTVNCSMLPALAWYAAWGLSSFPEARLMWFGSSAWLCGIMSTTLGRSMFHWGLKRIKGTHTI